MLMKHLHFILMEDISSVKMQQAEQPITEDIGMLNESVHEILQPVIGQPKILNVLHHVNQRLHENWNACYAKPPEILEHIDTNSTFTETAKYVQKCIKKMFQLSQFIQKQDHVLSKKEVQTEQAPNFLPEEDVLKFLLDSDYLLTIEQFYNMCTNIENKHLYDDIVWPLTCDFIPYNALEPSIHKGGQAS